jgi:anti-sigma B factor antagonist
MTRDDAPDELLRVEIVENAPYPTIALFGELDLSNAALLRDTLAKIEPCPLVAIDLSELSFIDSTGLSAIAQFGKRQNDAGGKLYLVITRPVVKKVFSITSLDQHFPVVESLDAIQP